MTNTYRKRNDGSWAIVVTDGSQSGAAVTITLRDGRTKVETLGEYLGTDSHQQAPLYAVAPKVAMAKAPRALIGIGNLSGVLALFDKAKAHMRSPTIVLSVPAIAETIKINVAGERARVPGSLNVVSSTKQDGYGNRLWYGRIHRDGRFEQANGEQAIVDRLIEFAKDPAGVARSHGHLTHHCCFCNIELTDPRSQLVGYGPICADHFGLPWGERPVAGEREMQAMEAAGDREQTNREERLKMLRKQLRESIRR